MLIDRLSEAPLLMPQLAHLLEDRLLRLKRFLHALLDLVILLHETVLVCLLLARLKEWWVEVMRGWQVS